MLPYHPRLIVVQEGGNDLHGGRSPEQFVADMKAFVEKVRAKLPGVPIIIGSIGSNTARWNEADTRRQANKLLKDYVSTQKNVSYIDFFESLLGSDGKPRPELFVADGMHPSDLGYQVRVKMMKPFLGPPDSSAK